MKNAFGLVIATFLGISVWGQTIPLTQQKLKDDFKVVNGKYEIYFHKNDLAKAIENIDQKLKSDNSKIANSILDGTIISVNFKSPNPTDKPVINLLSNFLGSYLIINGKVSIFKNNNQIKIVEKEESPPEVDFDNSVTNSIIFSEPGSTDIIFVGRFAEKLR
ncbi:MAG: hypothetical protein QM726_15795 [Chitinophagaceae bacterium]